MELQYDLGWPWTFISCCGLQMCITVLTINILNANLERFCVINTLYKFCKAHLKMNTWAEWIAQHSSKSWAWLYFPIDSIYMVEQRWAGPGNSLTNQPSWNRSIMLSETHCLKEEVVSDRKDIGHPPLVSVCAYMGAWTYVYAPTYHAYTQIK